MKKAEITIEDINSLTSKARNDLFDLLKQSYNENEDVHIHKNVLLFIDDFKMDYVYVDYISFKEETVYGTYEDESYILEFDCITLDELYNLLISCYL